MSAETHYLNALEALDQGDRDTARSEAKRATSLDPEHLEAWSVYVDASLPANGAPPSMVQAGQALAGIKKIVAWNPTESTCGCVAVGSWRTTSACFTMHCIGGKLAPMRIPVT